MAGRIEATGIILFTILFVWQLPHFLAIALFRKEEYRRAGLVSLPLTKGDLAATEQIVMLLLVLFAATVLPFFFGLAVVFPVLGHATWHLYRRTVSVDEVI